MGNLPSEREDKPPRDPRLLFLLRVMAKWPCVLARALALRSIGQGHEQGGTKAPGPLHLWSGVLKKRKKISAYLVPEAGPLLAGLFHISKH